MSKDVLIQITIYDDETGDVVKQIVENYSGEYAFEIVRFFEIVGEKVAKMIDPNHE